MQIVFSEENLHEKSKPTLWDKKEKYIWFVVCCMSPETGTFKG